MTLLVFELFEVAVDLAEVLLALGHHGQDQLFLPGRHVEGERFVPGHCVPLQRLRLERLLTQAEVHQDGLVLPLAGAFPDCDGQLAALQG